MTRDINKVAVIGAGPMGRGIAGQAANAGCEVVLLDKIEGAADTAVETMKTAKLPKQAFEAGLMDTSYARRITTGTIDENINLIGDADLVIEAVSEKLEIKHDVYNRLYNAAGPETLFSSNTSTFPISRLVEDMPHDFRARFMNTHFFNPPRFMHLLEMIRGPATTDTAFESVRTFADKRLGKKVIECSDSPAFIANRIGIFAMQRILREAEETGMPIEDIDAFFSTPINFSDMGMAKLADSVGLDIVREVGRNLSESLPSGDAFHDWHSPGLLDSMLEAGYSGSKAGSRGGFYRDKQDENGNPVLRKDGKPEKEVYDFASGDYRDAQDIKTSDYYKLNIPKTYGSYAGFYDSLDVMAEFSWPVMRDVLCYALNHASEIAYDPQSIDEAMVAGFNWQKGPFAMLDDYGLAWFTQKLASDGIDTPPLLDQARTGGGFYRRGHHGMEAIQLDGHYAPVRREDGVLDFDDIKHGQKPLLENSSARLWDIGDGVVAFEFSDKVKNALDAATLYALNESIRFVRDNPDSYKAMVIYNDGGHFSPGANLLLIDAFNKAADNKYTRALGLSNWLKGKVDSFVEDLIYSGQSVYRAMREAPFPVIGAPKGTPQNAAMGGGCEILMYCDAVQAGPEQVMGLPEAGLGLAPAWGGTTRYLARQQEQSRDVNGSIQVAKNAAYALTDPLSATSTSSQNARQKGWLTPNDRVTMNPDRVLADAKARALEMADNYTPPEPATFNLPGPSGKAAIRMYVDDMYLSDKGVNHVDVGVADAVANIVSGGETIDTTNWQYHVAKPDDALVENLNGRDNHCMTITPQLTLTESRMHQLEREAFMRLFNTEATKKRIEHFARTYKPLREQMPDPKPDPHELRDSITPVFTKLRQTDGNPLEGDDRSRLKQLADVVEPGVNRRHMTMMLRALKL